MNRTESAVTSTSNPAPTSDGAEVERLLAQGKAKRAVELAKLHHKQSNTPETEQRLVKAYVARIEQFQGQAMAIEARNLLQMVWERYPAARNSLARLRFRDALAEGRLGELLVPLASQQTSPDERRYIEQLIRQHLTDLRALARNESLPEAHPLRVGAAAIWKAFEAVTSGPVVDEQIALPMISHRSPLADWKLLIRAIAAFYRHDDEGVRRALAAIASGSAVQPLASALRGMADSAPQRTGHAGVLCARVVQDEKPLRSALALIDTALAQTSLTLLKKGIREAVAQCSVVRPEFVERLKQHISVACVSNGCPVDEVLRVMGPSRHDAYFWRLLARASGGSTPPPIVALYWERFLRHAVHEGMFSADGHEAAAVWLRIARALSAETPARMDAFRRRLRGMDVIQPYYLDQPPEIAALRPSSDDQLMAEVLDPGAAFGRSAKASPRVETFREWWAWAQRARLPAKVQEDIAIQWHQGLPEDAEPLVILSDLAEQRKALKLAVKRLGEAEAIDPLNPHVRRARLRLTLATTWRHFADRKAQLVEKDLADLGALPSMDKGDRRAVLNCLQAAWHLLRGESALAAECARSAAQEVGPLAGAVLFESVLQMARLDLADAVPAIQAPPSPTPLEVAQAEAKGVRLARELELDLFRPREWDAMIDAALQERPCGLSDAQILEIGIGAGSTSNMRQAYLASSAGLSRSATPAVTARLLSIRAQALSEPWGERRAAQCLRAAIELARSSHDEELTASILAQIDRSSLARRIMNPNTGAQAMTGERLESILANERRAETFPSTRAEADSFLAPHPDGLVEDDDADEFLPFGAGPFDDDDPDEQAGLFDYLGEDDACDSAASDAESFLDQMLKGLPSPIRAMLMGAIQKSGIAPEELRRNPRRLLKLIAMLGGFNPDDLGAGDLMDTDELLDGPPLGSSFRPRSERRNRNKKRRRR